MLLKEVMVILSQAAVNQQNHFSEYVLIRRVTRNFKGQEVFLELGHSDKHSPITHVRKSSQRKNIWFLYSEGLKNFILNENITHRWSQWGYFFSKFAGFFPIFKKGRENLHFPPLVTWLLIMARNYAIKAIKCSLISTPKMAQISLKNNLGSVKDHLDRHRRM